jgi:ABC-type multidrug transport system fused ATPase/permease subunit
MNKLKQYQKQIVTFITIFLLVTYGIFPALTTANTLINLVGFVGLVLLSIWGLLELKELITSTEGGLVDKEELKEAAKMAAKPKTKRKPKVTKSEHPLPPHSTTVKTSKPKTTK